jgi:hypothetical protein
MQDSYERESGSEEVTVGRRRSGTEDFYKFRDRGHSVSRFSYCAVQKRGMPIQARRYVVQEPFDSKWKTRCREKISSCHGFIALLSNHTWRARGARWEIGCARQELGRDKMLGIHIHADDKRAVPPELGSVRVVEWRWDTIANFVRRVEEKMSFWDRVFS